MEDLKEILNSKEVANHLRVSQRTIIREVESGRLEAFRVGRSLRFTRESVEEYKKKQKVIPGETIEEDLEEDQAA